MQPSASPQQLAAVLPLEELVNADAAVYAALPAATRRQLLDVLVTLETQQANAYARYAPLFTTTQIDERVAQPAVLRAVCADVAYALQRVPSQHRVPFTAPVELVSSLSAARHDVRQSPPDSANGSTPASAPPVPPPDGANNTPQRDVGSVQGTPQRGTPPPRDGVGSPAAQNGAAPGTPPQRPTRLQLDVTDDDGDGDDVTACLTVLQRLAEPSPLLPTLVAAVAADLAAGGATKLPTTPPAPLDAATVQLFDHVLDTFKVPTVTGVVELSPADAAHERVLYQNVRSLLAIRALTMLGNEAYAQGERTPAQESALTEIGDTYLAAADLLMEHAVASINFTRFTLLRPSGAQRAALSASPSHAMKDTAVVAALKEADELAKLNTTTTGAARGRRGRASRRGRGGRRANDGGSANATAASNNSNNSNNNNTNTNNNTSSGGSAGGGGGGNKTNVQGNGGNKSTGKRGRGRK